MRIASKVGNLAWVLELFAMYATDGRTDEINAYCPLPYGRGNDNWAYIIFINNEEILQRWFQTQF